MFSASIVRWFWLIPLVALLSTASCSSNKRSKGSRSERTANVSRNGSASIDAFVKEWEGVPYRYGGTSKAGVDCSGFVGALYRQVYQKELPRTTAALASSSKPVGKSALEEGDLVFFDMQGKKKSHVGVYLNAGSFVHASTSKGVIVSDLNNPYYQAAFSSGARP
ncbi:MAG: C40 family peptidase [Flavobacteriales bacterium]|nr:C40 family peptidase [Flavobacteriales bacterium]